MELNRQYYLDKILASKDTNHIKVLVGIKHCGKTTILKQYINMLRKDNKTGRIIYINFNDRKYQGIKTVSLLEKYIFENSSPITKNYIFLDEIQEVLCFENLILSLSENKRNDIYLAISSSLMFSKQMVTQLTNKCTRINVYPFSFLEFCQHFNYVSDSPNAWNLYKQLGGLPNILKFEDNHVLKEMFANSIVDFILNHYLIPHFKIRNTLLLKNILEFAFMNIGNELSPNSIAHFLKSNKLVRSISTKTVEKYLSYLADGFLLHKCIRYNIKDKVLLKTLYKYYAVDLGIRNIYLSNEPTLDSSKQLKNIVYLELLRRFPEVYTGVYQYTDIKNKTTVTKEIDFVCRKGSELVYIQVLERFASEDAMDRELFVIRKITDGRKIVLNDNDVNTTINGIDIISMKNWLVKY